MFRALMVLICLFTLVIRFYRFPVGKCFQVNECMFFVFWQRGTLCLGVNLLW